MAETRITDIVVPEVFVPYVIEETVNKSALIQSGIVIPDPQMDILAQRGGKLINMPFFTDLTGDDEVLADGSGGATTDSLTPGNVGTGKDIAVLHLRGRAWGVNDLAKALSGDDPMGAIASMVGQYWAYREQQVLIASLTGVFADNIQNDSSSLVHDISVGSVAATDDNKIDAEIIIDAAALLGDMADRLTGIMMHSTPYTRLRKLNLIDFIPDSEGRVNIPTYLGKRVIVDDNCPADAATVGTRYTTYLFGAGAIARGDGMAPVPVETDRNSLAGHDYLIYRRHFLLHPRGIKFTSSSVAGAAPTNTELKAHANWDRVYQTKNIRMVKLVTNG